MKHIALIEDDERLSQLIAQFLQKNEYQVSVIARGDLAVEFILTEQPDLVLLDINLPYMDGFAICRAVRTHFHKPILFLTAKDSDFDHVSGLEMGADDYIIKPIEPHVLLARIHNAFRRIQAAPVTHKQTTLNFGLLCIDQNARTVSYNQQLVALTSHEYELLVLLANKAGEIQSREFIHKKMIGREYDGIDRSVDVRISRLRKKLFDNLETPYRFITVWGKGYVFSPTAWEE